jgi:hypothetical protein
MMTPDELIADMARVLAGLQVGRSISTAPFGTALEPYDRLLHMDDRLGWKRPGDFEREIRKILGLDPVTGSCSAEVRHGPGHQSSTKCEVKGVHEVHRAIYGADRQEAAWRGTHVYTGAFDEPPPEES